MHISDDTTQARAFIITRRAVAEMLAESRLEPMAELSSTALLLPITSTFLHLTFGFAPPQIVAGFQWLDRKLADWIRPRSVFGNISYIELHTLRTEVTAAIAWSKGQVAFQDNHGRDLFARAYEVIDDDYESAFSRFLHAQPAVRSRGLGSIFQGSPD